MSTIHNDDTSTRDTTTNVTPDDLLHQVKQQGAFDQLRKRILTDFQEHTNGQVMLDRVDRVARQLVEQSPDVLRSRAYFLHAVLEELERVRLYDTLKLLAKREFLDTEVYQREIHAAATASLTVLRQQPVESSAVPSDKVQVHGTQQHTTAAAVVQPSSPTSTAMDTEDS